MPILRQNRPGVSLLEVLIAVVMTSAFVLATVWELRELLWVARQNHRALVADSLAWDVVWRAYNAQGWTMPATMTNSELTVGCDSTGYRLAGAAILSRAPGDGSSRASTIALVVGDQPALAENGRKLRFLTSEVSWYDDQPVKTDTSAAAVKFWHRRRVGLYKPVFERSWQRVEEDVLATDDVTGGDR